MVYKWNYYEMPVSAQEVGEHIEKLTKQHGTVTKQMLVDDARPTTSLLHPLYEWDDKVAGEKYRLFQSGKIMSNLVIVTVKVNNEHNDITPNHVRAFISESELKETAHYTPTIKALTDEETYLQVVKNAKKELQIMERKYKGILDFKELLKEYIQEET